ncbi:ketoacyl-synt-domain-containing protein [Viridothelium virens]|uniref:Ketoacyl-synt-domain-containing protein n=1 Tax=Viridothelium virens TaxID=1048519 RepID=A0A6A6GYJ5_VIRVR|nr:ketoacyl-synt-domain-containing protein [Viridothelium virens]
MAGRVTRHIQSLGESGSFAIHPIAATSDGLGPSIHKLLGNTIRERTSLLAEPQLLGPHELCNSPTAKSKIAIVGMSGRFPHAQSMDALWDILVRGVDTHELVPPSRWNANTHVGEVTTTSATKNVSGTGFGCWLQDAADFDARFFNMSPREAPQVDPAQRIALLTAAEALEHAGIVPGRTQSTQKDRVGVYFGSTSNDWMETNSAQDIDTYFIPGGNRAFIPGRINYHFKFSGPSYTIDTACSSSLAAIHLACNALWRGEVDTAIVGGTNVLTNPDMTAGLDRGHFLSRTGNCKTFDDLADGYCRGEAVATAILKRFEDAVVDKDPIQACILAIATNHSAEADSITRPHVGAQQALFEGVLAEAGVHANSISYCEMHGTGTQAGDAGETLSVLETLAPISPQSAVRNNHQPLHIGAAKSNVGHGEAAAGVTSLAKVLLMLKHSTIPPHCGIKTKINHKLPDLPSRNTFIAEQPVQWPRPKGSARQVLLNNFSAAGGNTALVLEDAPQVPRSDEADPRAHHVVAASAKTPASLENNLKKLITWIDGQDDSTNSVLSRLSYTTTARRMHHPHRVMAVGSDLTSVKKSLQASLEGKDGSSRPIGTPGFVFAFTGQGAHFAGMGSDLYSKLADFRADIQRYDQICLRLELPSIRSLFESANDAHSRATPTMLQLASVCFQMALFRMWLSFGVAPKAVVGHSLGEFAALYAAGVLSQADVISLVGRRAQLLESHCEEGSHAMLAIRSSATGLASLLGPPGDSYEVSCFNGRESTVLGGTRDQMNKVRPSLTKRGLSHTFLEVPYAYHTSQVDPVLTSLDSLARGIRFAEPVIPVISPACGKVIHQSRDFGSDFVARHCRASVNMLEALKLAKEEGLLEEKMIGVEIGSAPVVVKMIKEVAGSSFQTFASIQKGEDSWKLLSDALSKFYIKGVEVDWTAYHKDFESCQQCLDLPSYSWDLKEYWIQYVHDWSLRKGDPPLRIGPTKLESSSIHTIIQDKLADKGGELIVEADLSRPDLHPMVQGHKVYGVPLCTPSVYADIALTIGEYAKEILEPTNCSFGVEVADMTIQSALVANSDGKPQLLRTVARLDSKDRSVSCTFSSVNKNGKITEQHAHCLLRLFDVNVARQAQEVTAAQIKSRISSLKSQVGNSGLTFRFSKAMIYKMVGQLADFDPNYRGLVEITLDNDALEATGSVNFANVLKEGRFHTNPAYIDALSQLGGFVMNGNEGVDLDKELFVNHGWRSLQLFESIDPSKMYSTHVKMTEGEDKLWSGDITIFDEDAVVGTFGGVALQGVPKRLMQYIVNAANKRISAPTSSKPSTATSGQDCAQTVIKKTTTHKSTIAQRSVETPAVTIALQIISQESGIAMNELTDESRFDDIGVDSLLSLMVSSRIRDELGIDLESSIFLEFNTIGGFKTYLKGLNGQAEESTTITETMEEEIVPIRSDTLDIDTLGMEANWKSALTIIAEESQIDVADLTNDVSFADIGVDSLLSLVICSRMRDELDLEISDRSLFLEFPNVGGLKNYITGESQASETGKETSGSEPSMTPPSGGSSPSSIKDFANTPDTEILDTFTDNSVLHSHQVLPPVKPAWSITLQGSSKRATKRLFLFPDGCGAATSYVKLPRIASSTAIIGFNSPFMRNPHEMDSRRLPEIVLSYIEGVRKHQPSGPYHLGGWSAGGILAYAVAQELMASGEEIATLTLIDSPAPTDGLDRLPRRFFDHCSKVGIFGLEMDVNAGQNGLPPEPSRMPEWLMPHFEATIELLHDYHAPPMPVDGSSPGRVTIIWAGACAFDGKKYAYLPPATAEDEDTEGMKFLTERRTDLGPGKWAQLFPDRDVSVFVVDDEHHFSMMRAQGGERLGELIRESMGPT